MLPIQLKAEEYHGAEFDFEVVFSGKKGIGKLQATQITTETKLEFDRLWKSFGVRTSYLSKRYRFGYEEDPTDQRFDLLVGTFYRTNDRSLSAALYLGGGVAETAGGYSRDIDNSGHDEVLQAQGVQAVAGLELRHRGHLPRGYTHSELDAKLVFWSNTIENFNSFRFRYEPDERGVGGGILLQSLYSKLPSQLEDFRYNGFLSCDVYIYRWNIVTSALLGTELLENNLNDLFRNVLITRFTINARF